MIYLNSYLLIISIIAIFAIIISLILSFKIKEIRLDLDSIKKHEESHSLLQIALLEKMFEALEKTHPNILDEVDKIKTEHNYIGIFKKKSNIVNFAKHK